MRYPRGAHPGSYTLPILAVCCLTLVCSMPAYGVIPSLLGPLQGLLAIIPQILLFIAAGAAAIFSRKQWRMFGVG